MEILKKYFPFFLALPFLFIDLSACAQNDLWNASTAPLENTRSLETPLQDSLQPIWNLRLCIDYARKNNLQVHTSELNYQKAKTDLKAAQAARYPSLSFGSNQGFTNGNKINENGNFVTNPQYTGTYSLSTQIVIYDGSRLTHTLKQRKTELELNLQGIQKSQNEIEVAVTKAYLEILYATEALKTDSTIVETSRLQWEQSQAKYEAGSLNISDMVRFKAQYGSDNYHLTVSRNQLKRSLLNLKQLLELDIDEPFQIDFPHLDQLQILEEVPSLHQVYYTALETMPEMKKAKLQIESSLWNEKVAFSGRLPSLSFNASVGTGYYTSADYAFLNQLGNNINENISIGIAIPIYQNREVKSSIEKAKIQTQQSQLDLIETQKELLSTIETLYQDAIASQERYKAAHLQIEATTESYALMQEQYKAGLKTLVDVFTEKDKHLAALQEMLSAKYQAALSIRLLNFYQNEPILL